MGGRRRGTLVAALGTGAALAWGAHRIATVAEVPPTVLARAPEGEAPARRDLGRLAVGPLRSGTSPARTTAARRVVESTDAAARLLPAWTDGAIADLAHDHVPENAMHAMRRLERLGSAARPRLEIALDSTDRQQRQLAGILLRALDGPPSERLLAVTLEALELDDLPRGAGRHTPCADNGGDAAAWLAERPELIPRVEATLVAGLASADRHRRLLSAWVLASTRNRAHAAGACEVLVEHLEDNRIDFDAQLACDALYRLGRQASPHLRSALATADMQAREAIRTLLVDIEGEAARRGEVEPAIGRMYNPSDPSSPSRMMLRNPHRVWEQDDGFGRR